MYVSIVCREYGVLDETLHTAHHAVFIIDIAGVVQGYRVTGTGGLQPDTASDMLEYVRTATGTTTE